MFYPHPESYEWPDLYQRFLTGKLELPDSRLNGRWEWSCGVGDHALDAYLDVAPQIRDVRNFSIRQRLGTRYAPQYDSMIYDATDQDLDIITRLGAELRAAAVGMPNGWRVSAVAVMATASPELLSIARRENVYVLTCEGIHTPYNAPAPRATTPD